MNNAVDMPTLDAPVLCIMGPTAAGKTGLAVELVQRFPFDIISVDSALVYRGMDIGTAKPDAATLRSAPHRLIDFLDPAEAYSAARFRADCLREMEQIRAAGRLPLLVGGTMLYFRALQQGLSPMPSADAQRCARVWRRNGRSRVLRPCTRSLPWLIRQAARAYPPQRSAAHFAGAGGV